MTHAAVPHRQARSSFDLYIVALTAALVGIGIVAVFSASFAKAALSAGDSLYLVKRQALAAVLGVGAMLLVARLNLQRVRLAAYGIAAAAAVLLILVLAFGVNINGARRWFQIGFFHFQPSEFAKLAIVLAVARYALEHPDRMRSLKGLAIPLAGAAAAGLLIVIEPDLGTALMVVALAFLICNFAGARLRHLALYGLVGLVFVVGAVFAEPYRLDRVKSWLHPGDTALTGSYQMRHSVIALGAGGPIGRGLAESREKYSYLPAAETDCIFAIIGEEMGLIGTWGLLALFGLLAWRGLGVSLRAADPFHALLGAGVTSLILAQVILNVAVVTGLLPTKGAPLPFVSYGGSALVFTMAGVGLLLNISRQRVRSGRAPQVTARWRETRRAARLMTT